MEKMTKDNAGFLKLSTKKIAIGTKKIAEIKQKRPDQKRIKVVSVNRSQPEKYTCCKTYQEALEL